MSTTPRKVEPHPYNGFQSEGEPKGTYREFDGFLAKQQLRGQVYMASKKSAARWSKPYEKEKVALLILPDENGISHDSMMLADQFAEAGLYTYVCGYTGISEPPAKYLKENTNYKARNPKASGEKTEDLIVDDIVEKIADGRFLASDKIQRFVVAGFGSGAKQALRLLATNTQSKKYNFVAGFIASPAGQTICSLEAYAGVIRPLSIAVSDDPESKTDAAEREVIRNGVKLWTGPYQINLFSHVRDGFAVRRAVASQPEVFAKREAFVQALKWFDFYLFEDSV